MVSYLTPLPLYQKFARVFTLMLLYITMSEVLTKIIDADTRIKRIQIGDHKIKQ